MNFSSPVEARVVARLPVDYVSEALAASEGFKASSAFLSPFSTPSEIEVRKDGSGRDLVLALHYVVDEPPERTSRGDPAAAVVLGCHSKKIMSVVFRQFWQHPDAAPLIPDKLVADVKRQLEGQESGQFVFERTASLVNRLLLENWDRVKRGAVEGAEPPTGP